MPRASLFGAKHVSWDLLGPNALGIDHPKIVVEHRARHIAHAFPKVMLHSIGLLR
jgi:hypothetical protein